MLVDTLDSLFALGQFDGLLAEREHPSAPFLLDTQHTGVAVESREAGTVAILHLRQVHLHNTTALGTFHALRQRIGSQEEVGNHPTGLQAQPARTLGETPRSIHRIVVPLPVQAQLSSGEVVTADDVALWLSRLHHTHTVGNTAFLIAQQGPSVNPTAGHQRGNTAHTATVLEDNGIPVAILTVDNGTLSDIGETAKVGFQDDVLLIRSTDVVGTVADLTAVTTRDTPYLRDHQQVIAPLVLQHATALQNARFVSLTLEQLVVGALDDVGEVLFQFHHLTRTIDHIYPVIIVEEQRAVVEVAHARQQRPRSLSALSRIDIGITHRTRLVRCQKGIETSVMILQRRGPLSASVGCSLTQVVLRRVGQAVEDVADGLPILQVTRAHDGRTRHEVHRGADHIIRIAYAYDVRVGHISPQHGIGGIKTIRATGTLSSSL